MQLVAHAIRALSKKEALLSSLNGVTFPGWMSQSSCWRITETFCSLRRSLSHHYLCWFLWATAYHVTHGKQLIKSSGRESLFFFSVESKTCYDSWLHRLRLKIHPQPKNYPRMSQSVPDTCFVSLLIKVSSVVNFSHLSSAGKKFILLTPVVAFRSLESRKEREQVPHPRVRWNGPRNRALSASPQSVRMPAQR